MKNTPIIKPINSNNWLVFAENDVKILNCEIQGVCWFGMHSYINNGFIRSHSEIGRFCSIGRNVSIGLGVHDYNNFSTHPLLSNGKRLDSYFVDKNRRVVIGNDVWIGDRVLINSGIVIGDGCVIAAGSVVTKDIPPYSIVGGVPARFIKYRFSEDIIDKLIALKWWNYSLDKINLHRYETIENFIDKMKALGNPDNIEMSYIKFKSGQ